MIRIASIALTVAIASMTSVVTPAIAANCKKGIPCGNSCIAASKTVNAGEKMHRRAGEKMHRG